MANRNGRGPNEKGPGTGRGLGPCKVSPQGNPRRGGGRNPSPRQRRNGR